MSSSISQPNLVKNPLTSALNSKINPSPLGVPKISNIGSSLSINPKTTTASSTPSYYQQSMIDANKPYNPTFTGPGSGLSNGVVGALGNVGNFFNNLVTGKSGGYNGGISTSVPSTPTVGPSTSKGTLQGFGTQTGGKTQSNTGSLTNLSNGGVTAGGGSYAGPASSNPNGIPTSSASTTTPVQNQGFGTSTGGINSGNSAPTQVQATPTISTTPNYAAGQGYATGGAPQTTQQTDPSQTYGTGLNTQINYANGPGNSAVNTSVSGLQGQASNTPQSQAQGYLQGVAQNGTPAVNQANQALSSFTQGGGKLLNEIQSDPGLAAAVSSGIAGNVGQQLGTTQGALAQQVQNALSGQSNQIGAAENAGGLANTNQSNQITAGSNAGTTAQNQQSEQIGAAGNATGQASPVTQFGVLTNPTNGQPIGGGTPQSAAFYGGQIQNSVAQGTTYSNNDATLQALNGQDGKSGMVGSFNQALQSAGTNTNTLNLSNALNQGLSANTSGVYAGLQNNFQNILAQYAKILGTQKVNSLLTSSQSGTIGQFLNNLTAQAQGIQSGLKGAGTGQTQNTSQTSGSNGNPSGGSLYSF